MSDPISNEKLFGFLKTALDAAAVRHQTIAGNLANIDTPGYKARDLNFEQVLRDYEDHEAMALPRREDAPGRMPAAPALDIKDYFVEVTEGRIDQRFDGNNVDLDMEMAKLSKARGRYKMALNFMNRKIRLLTEVINMRV